METLRLGTFFWLQIYGSGLEPANAWDVFRRTPSRGDRGRRAAVDVLWMRTNFAFFSLFFSLNAHGLQ